MLTSLANAAWFSALVTNRASAIAAARFLLFFETDRPCTYSGGVSERRATARPCPASDGLSVARLVMCCRRRWSRRPCPGVEELGVARVRRGSGRPAAGSPALKASRYLSSSAAASGVLKANDLPSSDDELDAGVGEVAEAGLAAHQVVLPPDLSCITLACGDQLVEGVRRVLRVQAGLR